MRILKIVLPSAIVLGGLTLCTSSMYGTPDYAKKEKKGCTFCHAKAGEKSEMAKNLNTTGTCYKENDHSLAKCEAPKK